MEDTKTVSIRNWTHCPFRGLPKISIDNRCPPTLQALPVSVDIGIKEAPAEPAKRGRPKKDEVRIAPTPITEEVAMLVPVLEEESYCDTCITAKIRELELGLVSEVRISGQGNFRPEKKRGRPKKS